MQGKQTAPGRTVQDEREAYFSGEISAHEYLRRVLPHTGTIPEPEGGLTQQLKRILVRLGGGGPAGR